MSLKYCLTRWLKGSISGGTWQTGFIQFVRKKAFLELGSPGRERKQKLSSRAIGRFFVHNCTMAAPMFQLGYQIPVKECKQKWRYGSGSHYKLRPQPPYSGQQAIQRNGKREGKTGRRKRWGRLK